MLLNTTKYCQNKTKIRKKQNNKNRQNCPKKKKKQKKQNAKMFTQNRKKTTKKEQNQQNVTHFEFEQLYQKYDKHTQLHTRLCF